MFALAFALGASGAATLESLRRALESELVVPATERLESADDSARDARVAFRFAHDRVRQAALSLLDDDHQLIASLPRMWTDIRAFLELDAVSFTKGCFIGQELVCRIDSRGQEFGPADCGAALKEALDNLKVAIQEADARITSVRVLDPYFYS